MQLFIPLGVLFLIGITLLRNYDTEIWGMILSTVAGLTLFIGGLVVITNQVSVHAELAAVEQLRSAAEQVNLQASEDVLGKVVDFNTNLASLKWYNKQWWADPFVPDAWESVPPINIR